MVKKVTVPPIIKDPKNKPGFSEDVENIRNADPLFPLHVDFDFESVLSALGEGPDESVSHFDAIAHHVGQILRWTVNTSKDEKPSLRKIGLRAVTLHKYLSKTGRFPIGGYVFNINQKSAN